jgi:hypothetical protein
MFRAASLFPPPQPSELGSPSYSCSFGFALELFASTLQNSRNLLKQHLRIVLDHGISKALLNTQRLFGTLALSNVSRDLCGTHYLSVPASYWRN